MPYLVAKKQAATFGVHTKELKNSGILKSHTGSGGGHVDLPETIQKFSYTEAEATRKPPLPSQDDFKAWEEKISMSREPKNFIKSNAIEQVRSKPPVKSTSDVDYLKKPDYGKVPPYIRKIKKQIADEYAYIQAQKEQENNNIPQGMRQLPEEERVELIEMLKSRWDEVNKVYQTTSVLSLKSLDSIGKIKRKEMYEAQLAQIERDIEKLSKRVVYVVDEEM